MEFENGIRKCEFCQKWDFQNVNFVKIDTVQVWFFGQIGDFGHSVEKKNQMANFKTLTKKSNFYCRLVIKLRQKIRNLWESGVAELPSRNVRSHV